MLFWVDEVDDADKLSDSCDGSVEVWTSCILFLNGQGLVFFVQIVEKSRMGSCDGLRNSFQWKSDSDVDGWWRVHFEK